MLPFKFIALAPKPRSMLRDHLYKVISQIVRINAPQALNFTTMMVNKGFIGAVGKKSYPTLTRYEISLRISAAKKRNESLNLSVQKEQIIKNRLDPLQALIFVC